jgi:beta-lactam-binding protein with PASTA domain
LVLPKPTDGVVPRLVGLRLERAQAKLDRKGFEYEVQEVEGKQPGRVVFQVPRSGVAAEKGMVVRLAVVKGD